MATTYMHLNVAWAVADSLPLGDRGQYYLGSIAPDSVNFGGFAEKAVRWKAHLRDEDFTQWHENVRVFYRDNRERCPDRDLLLGYAVHVLTDLAFDEYYFHITMPLMQSMEHPLIPDWDACIADCFRYDSGQMHARWWEGEVKEPFRRAMPRPIHSINADLLGNYQQWIAGEYDKTLTAEPALYVKDAVLGELAQAVREKCARYLG